MNKLTKKQLLVGALILLFAINLAALGTIIYQNYQSNQSIQPARQFSPRNMPGSPGRGNPGSSVGSMEPGANQGMGRRFEQFVRERLELDSQQFRQYQELLEKSRKEQRIIAMKLSEKRNQMMQEIARDKPDQQKLNDLASDIGGLHTQLKHNTINHFKELKSICRPDQLKALQQLMMNMTHRGHHQPRHNRPQGRRPTDRN